MIENFLAYLIPQAPQIVIGVIGLVLIQTRLKRSHPRAHLHATIGLTLLVVEGIIAALVLAILMSEYSPTDRVAFANKLSTVNLAAYVVTAAALAFLLAALLANREPIERR